MSYVSVDIESDGQIPGINSMVCFGAVIVKEGLKDTFYGQTKPITKIYNPDALAISGFSRQEHEKFDDPAKVMHEFADWIKLKTHGNPIFISDNNGFDFAWINYYFHVYYGSNPFGWSSRRIGDLYCGMVKNTFAKWKHLRDTKHNHNPVNDAMANAEAILKMQEMGLEIKLK